MTDPAGCLAEILGPQRMARLHERAQQMELDDQAVLRMVVEAWLGGHSTQPLQPVPVQGGLFANTSHPLPAPQKKMRRSVMPGLLPAATSIEREELDWRVDRVWEAHRTAWNRFWLAETGLPVRCPTQPNAEVRAAIVVGLRKHDGHLLGPEDREEWRAESQVRAAGIGIFYDPWMTGHAKENDVSNGGKRWLSHDRPWVQQRTKADPIERFAALYFENRAVFDEQDRRENGGRLPDRSSEGVRAGERLPLPATDRVLGQGGVALHSLDEAGDSGSYEATLLQELPVVGRGGRAAAVGEVVRAREGSRPPG